MQFHKNNLHLKEDIFSLLITTSGLGRKHSEVCADMTDIALLHNM